MGLADLKKGGKANIAAALSLIEEKPFEESIVHLLDNAFVNAKGTVIGITGPPGAGKSTLISALIGEWRRNDITVAVLAVDPSSKASKGALLGDRVRMRTDPSDDGVFVRSIAARGRLGGLADMTYPAAILLRALYARVIVESVGVGQSETDIAAVSDTVVLCIQPGSGDALQFMKAGIAEIPDIAVVTKADMGAAASRALGDLKGALGLAFREEETFEPQCLAVSATASTGLDELLAAIASHEAWLHGGERFKSRRRQQARQWLEAEILRNFGKKGLDLVSNLPSRISDIGPFEAACKLLLQLQVVNSGCVTRNR